MITTFICANIYAQLLVCAVQPVLTYGKPTTYNMLLTDQKWYVVNRCTGERAVAGQPYRHVPESKWCVD